MRTSTAGGLSLYYLGDTLICTLWGLMQLLLKCILFKIKNNAKHVNATLLILQPKKKLMNQCVNFPYIIVFRSMVNPKWVLFIGEFLQRPRRPWVLYPILQPFINTKQRQTLVLYQTLLTYKTVHSARQLTYLSVLNLYTW
jgi:hypothetical protein